MAEDHMEALEEEREASQRRQLEILQTIFAAPLAALKKAADYLGKRYNLKFEEVEPAFVGFLLVCLFFLIFLTPVLVREILVDGFQEGGTAAWTRVIALILVFGIPFTAFVYGRRGFFRGNLTAMRLVRLGGDGKPTGREAAMTRQDMDTIKRLLGKPARMFSFRSFGPAELGILVEKDFKRACTIYLGPKNKSAVRAGRRMWNWSLPGESERVLWELLAKYRERLGEDLTE